MRKLYSLSLTTLLFAAFMPLSADDVDDYIKQRIQELHLPGLSVTVLKEGKIVKSAGFGLANLETNTPADAKTVYKTASLSKPFLAAAIMLLVQDGKVALDDRAWKYLDGAPASWKEITIRQLLTHTAGIVRDPADYHPYQEQPIASVIQAVYALPLSFQPGEKLLYSNVGYYALAEIIGKVSGKPWNEFIAERIFAPAAMTSTRLTTITGIVPNRANGYQQAGDGMINAENWIAVRPSGAFLSTIEDLAKWDAFLTTGTVLTASSREQMWKPVTLNDHTTAGYGFGWYVDSFLGRARLHHDGQFPGFRSDYERFVDDRLTVIVLANSDSVSVESLALKIAGFYAPSLIAPPFTLTAQLTDRSVEIGKPVTIEITARDDGNAAPESVVEMEIWDAAGKAVFKQDKSNESFAAGQTKTFLFHWKPGKAGHYSVNLGAYGAKWTPSFAWKQNVATITVN